MLNEPHKTLNAMILLSMIDGEMHQTEESIIRQFSKEYNLNNQLEDMINKSKKLSVLQIEKKLIEISKNIRLIKDRYSFMCQISILILADSIISKEEHEALSKVESNLGIDFGYNISNQIVLDKFQEQIVQTDYWESMAIDAKAGSGKTEIIPHRIIKLIDQDKIEEGFIWIISFSRAAVAAMRERIVSKIGVFPKNLVIATIDSTTFKINSSFGFAEYKMESGQMGYEENVKLLLQKFNEENFGLKDFLLNLQHLIVDEAQDIVGIRRLLVEGIIESLNEDCGVSIFGDRAQAIYGFTAKEFDDKRSLLELAYDNELSNRDWKTIELEKVYRSDNRKVLKTINAMRKLIIETPPERDDQKELYPKLKRPIADGTYSTIVTKDDAINKMQDNSMCITHDSMSRFQFILEAQKYKKYFRLRGTEYPEYIFSWLSGLFNYFKGRNTENFDIHDFKDFYLQELHQEHKKQSTFWSLWNKLLFLAEDPELKNSVSITLLRNKLGRNPLAPPFDFSPKTFGYSGTLIGTAHRLKGLEEDDVIYKEYRITKAQQNRDKRLDTEGRNEMNLYGDHNKRCFVAATRTRKKLFYLPENEMVVNEWNNFYIRTQAQGLTRYYKNFVMPLKLRKANLMGFNMEVGLKGDYLFESIILNQENNERVMQTQEFLRRVAEEKMDKRIQYKLRVKEDEEKRNRLNIHIEDYEADEEYYLGQFDEHLGLTIHKIFNKIVPDGYRYVGTRTLAIDIRLMDIATFAVSEDSREYSNSLLTQLTDFPEIDLRGSWLYPVLYGIGPVIVKKGVMDNIDRWVKN